MEAGGPGSFSPLLDRLSHLVEFMVTLSTGSIVLLAGSSVFRGGGRLPWFYASPLTLLAVSVIYALAFLAITLRDWEDFQRVKKSYTRGRYVLEYALGYSAFISFALGYLLLVVALVNS